MFFYHAKKVISLEDCQGLISQAESIGFKEADVRFYESTKRMENIRNNSRIEFQNPEFLDKLETLLIQNLGDSFPFIMENKKLQKDVTFSCLNNHLRFYRYEIEQYFKPHKDGGYDVDGKESLITVLLYLNDCSGGETVLMPDGPSKKESFIYIQPSVGDVLLFEHPIWHEGKPVASGKKYVLRSDMFYSK